MTKDKTLAEAFLEAQTYWEATGKGNTADIMTMRAGVCIETLIEVDARGTVYCEDIDTSHATKVLTALSERGLSRSSVHHYYGAFKRVLTLAGYNVGSWPKAPVAERKVKSIPSDEDIYEVLRAADLAGETKDLVRLILYTGMRVKEALGKNFEIGGGGDCLLVQGKGGHERLIPLDPRIEWLGEHQGDYTTHLKRLKQACKGARVKPFTFHALRHKFATDAYHRSNRNLKVVQQLLGHSDISTTARYIGVDMDDMREAMGL